MAEESSRDVRDAGESEVETFIRRMHDLDFQFPIVFRPEGMKDQPTVIDKLRDAIAKYEQSRGNKELLPAFKGACLLAINEAILSGKVREGEALIRKLKASEARCNELEKENSKLTAEYYSLKARYEQTMGILKIVSAEASS